MNDREFEKIVDRRLSIVQKILTSKTKEYATDKDRLHNFKRSSEVLGVSPAKSCFAYFTKHLVSIMDMVDFRRPSQLAIDEKFTDAINYLLLLEALLVERENEKRKNNKQK